MKARRLSVGRVAPTDRSATGMTLIELMVTLVVLAVMLAIAAPNFATFQRNSELTSTANSFIAALSAARAEAMKRQLDAYVFPGSPASPSEDWNGGWFVFIDTNNDQTYTAGTDIIIQVQNTLPSSISASGLVDGTRHYARFSGAGFLRKLDGSFGLTTSIDFSNASETRKVIAAPAGRFRVCKPADAGCNTTAF